MLNYFFYNQNMVFFSLVYIFNFCLVHDLTVSGATNPYDHVKNELCIDGKKYQYFSLHDVDPEKYGNLD